MTISSVNSNSAQMGINQNKSSADNVLSKLAAMHTINNESPADLMLYNQQQSQLLEESQKLQNANESYAMLKISSNSLESLRQGVTDLQTQSVARNSAALNSDQRAMIDADTQATMRAMQTTIEQTSYNGQALISDVNLGGLESGDSQSLESFASMLDGKLSDVGAATNEVVSQIKQHSTMMESLSLSKQTKEYDVAEFVNLLQSSDAKLNASLFAQLHTTDTLAKRVSTLLA